MRRFIQHNNYAHCWQYCVWVFPLLLSVARPQNIKNWTYKQNTPSTRKKKAKMKQGKTAKMPLIPFPVLLNSLTLLLVPVSGHP